MDGLKLFGVVVAAFVALMAAVVVAGLLYEALGLWATTLWGLVLSGGLAALLYLYARADP